MYTRFFELRGIGRIEGNRKTVPRPSPSPFIAVKAPQQPRLVDGIADTYIHDQVAAWNFDDRGRLLSMAARKREQRAAEEGNGWFDHGFAVSIARAFRPPDARWSGTWHENCPEIQ